MCTLSFVPRRNGYVVAMNRDERRSRVEALPPHRFQFSEIAAVYPHEPGGGTWIAVNDRSVTLALLNLGDSSGPKQRSRGEIIPALIESLSMAEADIRLRRKSLRGYLPFRLVGIFGGEGRVAEWRWSGRKLRRRSFPWRRQHWFSSGLSDAQARRHRQPILDAAWKRRSAGSLPWLRRIHRSHSPQAGAFSICVHRPDAATRSYTEIVWRHSAVTMRYRPGCPCTSQGEAGKVVSLPTGR